MTSQISVITNYCIHDIHNDKNGIMLELDASNTSDVTLRYFDCSIFSRFANEDEKIFFGGSDALRFSAIKRIQNDEDYMCFIKAMEIFMDAMNAKNNNKSIEITKYDYQIINGYNEMKISCNVNRLWIIL